MHLAQEPERVVITIDDDGPGIPPSQRDKVFEPFYRQERSRNPETGGVGLGLSVARSIIWEHSGDIRLANRREGGLHVAAMPRFEHMVEAENRVGRRIAPPSSRGTYCAGQWPSACRRCGCGGTGKLGDKAPADQVMVGGLKF